MKCIDFIYENQQELEKVIAAAKLSKERTCMVRIYTAIATQEEAVALAQDIQKLIPHAKVLGTSTCGVIFKGEQMLESTLVCIREYESVTVFTDTFTWGGKSAGVIAGEIADAIDGKNIKVMHVLCGDHYYDVNDFVVAFSRINQQTRLIGGVSGDVLPKDIAGYVFTPEGVVPEGIVVAGLSGERLQTYTGVNISHEAISPKFKLTDIDGGYWKTVDGEDANTWFREQLGITQLQDYSDWQVICDNDVMVRFPIILEGHSGASRFLKYDGSENSISQYFSQLPAGVEFRIGYVSPSECARSTFQIYNEVMDHPIEDLFSYTCLFRRLYLHNCAEWELSPYKDVGICGAFMMGEISSIDGHNEFLNGSCCMIGTAENEVYIRPDIGVFEKLSKIEDDTRDLYNLVLKRQSEKMNAYNEQLLDKITTQQQTVREQMLTDFNTGVSNFLKFTEDAKQVKFDKLCMVKIENAELMTAHLGHAAYTEVIRRALSRVRETIAGMDADDQSLLSFYVFNESTFFMVANERMSETHFLSICRMFFNEYRIITLPDSDELLICRFVVVVEQEDPFESALNALQASKNTQTPFLVCKQGADDNFSTDEEFKMIGVLNRALSHDNIVPYFQGIYDNTEQCITKYEALMRIVDVDGTVYAPASFMSIAKKYHLYSHLSRRMFQKVFKICRAYHISVEVNLSVFDINSTEVQELIFEGLRSLPDPSLFVLEILEDEEFRDIMQLRNFIKKAKALGAKVAIDDFGAGYSNLLEIASIEPDYIKIDGGIVRHLDTNELNRKILDVTVYIGKLFDAEIIAEFVENEGIQRHIEFYGIRYSQGYYFAKPVPFRELLAPVPTRWAQENG